MPVSNKPSDHQSGGQQFGITAGKVEIVDACFIVDQYAADKGTGKAGALMTVAQVSLQPLTDNWEPDPQMDAVDNHYGVGSKFNQLTDGTWHLTFYPSNDPNSVYDKDMPAPDVGSAGDYLEGLRQPDKLSRWSQFMAACVKNGFNQDKVEHNIKFLIGSKFEIGPVKFTSVGKEEQIAAPIARFHTYPYEVSKATPKGKAATAPAAKKPAASAPAKTAAPAQAPAPVAEPAAPEPVDASANGHDANALAMYMIEKVLNNERGKGKQQITINALGRDVLAQALQKELALPRDIQKAIGANAKDPEFLGMLADTYNFTVEGDAVKLLPAE